MYLIIDVTCTDATVSLRLHDVAKITLYMNRRLTAENMYNVGWHEGRELYIILKPCLLTPYMISCSTSVSPCYVLRDTRLPPVFTYMYVFCACSLMCVYVYCGTAVHIHQQPFVCICNVKHLCVRTWPGVVYCSCEWSKQLVEAILYTGDVRDNFRVF